MSPASPARRNLTPSPVRHAIRQRRPRQDREPPMRDVDRTGASPAPPAAVPPGAAIPSITLAGATPRAPDSGGVELHRIVIVGGGAGGLELATRLGRRLGKRRQAWITLLDRGRTHIWKPLLHEVASGTMDSQ